jgi:4-hydroxy-tetrahydrodipicolinate reductase
LEIIEETAQRVPVILAANFSVGVNTLFWLSRRAAELLGDSFDIEVVETHHRLKKDAPSGTAKRLAQLLAEVRRLSYDENVAHGP